MPFHFSCRLLEAKSLFVVEDDEVKYYTVDVCFFASFFVGAEAPVLATLISSAQKETSLEVPLNTSTAISLIPIGDYCSRNGLRAQPPSLC